MASRTDTVGAQVRPRKVNPVRKRRSRRPAELTSGAASVVTLWAHSDATDFQKRQVAVPPGGRLAGGLLGAGLLSGQPVSLRLPTSFSVCLRAIPRCTGRSLTVHLPLKL